MTKIIGLSGVARSGKDTLFSLLGEILNKKVKRYALADALKNDIRESLIKKYNIDVFNCTPEQKEIIRPELIRYGGSKRKESNGTYWTSLVEKQILKDLAEDPDIICVVTDVRYDEYENDEVYWIKEKMGGMLIHLERILDNGEILQAPNDDEKRNDPLLKEKSDINLIWKTSSDRGLLKKVILDQINFLNNGLF